MEKKRKSTCLLLILSLVLLFTSFDSPRVLAADDLIFSCHIITKEESRDNQCCRLFAQLILRLIESF